MIARAHVHLRSPARLVLLVGAAALALLVLTTRFGMPPVAGADTTALQATTQLASGSLPGSPTGCWVPGDLIGEANPASITAAACGR